MVMSILLAGCKTTTPVEEANNDDSSMTEDDTDNSSTDTLENDEAEQAEPILVGFINYSDDIDATRLVHEGMQKKADELGIEMLYATAKTDAAQMISNADNMILQGVDVLVDFNFNMGGGAALKEKCDAAGIPLISIDMNYGEGTYYAGVSNQLAGEFSGEGAVEFINEKFGGEIEYLVISVGNALGEEINKRTRGAADAIRAAGIDLPAEKVIEIETGSGDTTQLATQQTTDFLTAHPDATKVLFIGGNDQNGLGFQAAIINQNREDDCLIVTHGCEAPARLALHENDPVWVGSVDYQFEKYADTVFDIIMKLMAGEEVPQESFVKLAFVTADNINDFYPAE